MSLFGDIRGELATAIGHEIGDATLARWAETWKHQGIPDWVARDKALFTQVRDRLAKSILADCLVATGATVRKVGTVIAQEERNGSWTVTLTDGAVTSARSRHEVQELAQAHFQQITGKDIGIGTIEWRT